MIFKKIKLFAKGVASWLRPLHSSERPSNHGFKAQVSKFLAKMRTKQRLVVMDAETYREHWSFRLSVLNIFVGVGILGIFFMVITFLLIAFTPLHNIIPGYSNDDVIDQTYHNITLLDTLDYKVHQQEKMIAVLSTVVSGKPFSSTPDGEEDNRKKAQGGPDIRNVEDSLLRNDIENQHLANKNTAKHNESQEHASSGQLFFPPIKGKVISKYNYKGGHYGVDIAGNMNEIIKAAATGTVFFAGFSADDEYVLAIQHPGNIITIYKHNSALMKSAGDIVRAGEPIAYLGRSANSTTPHLHFEVWINGKTVDPLTYVSF